MDNEREGGYESRWAPTRDVTGHDGGPLPADLCFFEAPPELGPVLTAHSNMSAGAVVVKGDKQREANETLYVDLFGASGNAVIGVARGVGTIWNDDNRA